MKFVEFNYRRPDIAETKTEFYAYLDQLKKAENSQAALEAIQNIQGIQSQLDSQGNIAYIRNSINTTDTFYEDEMEFWNNTTPIISEWVSEYYQAVLDSPFREDLGKDIPETFFKIIEQDLKTFDPKIIPLLQKENNLVTEYDKLVASAQVEYQGESYNLSALTPFLESTDRQVRKEVSDLKAGFFADHQEDFDRLFDELVKVRHEMAQELGFEDFVELGYLRMKRLDYDHQDVEVFRKEVLEQIVPLAQEIFSRQGQRLGIEDLKHYDLALEFESGNAKPKGTPEQIVAKAGQMYAEMSPETDEFFDFMVKHGLMDLETKKGKASGGYCTYISAYNSPFIFANFNGTSGDVDVLTHEAGHAFQVYRSRWITTPEILWPTNESAEIHSMSMEFIAWPWMDLFFEEATPKYKYAHLAGAATFLPYGVLVDHFQHEIYENPDMTPEERRQTWRRLEKMYNPWIDYADNDFLEAGGFWFRQGHIFGVPFYYIDYTLAQVCAFQFWERSQIQQDSSYWTDYLKICRLGGSQSFGEIVKTANLKSPFEAGSLASVTQSIREYLENVPEEDLV